MPRANGKNPDWDIPFPSAALERPRIDPVADREHFRCNPLLFPCKGGKIPLLGGAAKSGDKATEIIQFLLALRGCFRGRGRIFPVYQGIQGARNHRD